MRRGRQNISVKLLQSVSYHVEHAQHGIVCIGEIVKQRRTDNPSVPRRQARGGRRRLGAAPTRAWRCRNASRVSSDLLISEGFKEFAPRPIRRSGVDRYRDNATPQSI
jgi:hypothetical protein